MIRFGTYWQLHRIDPKSKYDYYIGQIENKYWNTRKYPPRNYGRQNKTLKPSGKKR